MNRTHHLLLCLLACFGAFGCASQQPLEPRTLPYHVVVVPMDEPLVGTVSAGEFDGEATGMQVELTPEEVTAAVSDALAEYCFADVTVLSPADFPEATDAYQLERAVLGRAREVHADLVVELSLRYDAEIYRTTASTYWLNYPLFLFAGPSNWFIGDNVYYADVDLTTAVYDLNVIEAGGFALGDPSSRILSASSRYTGKDLDFVDRSDGAEDYALGILIPSGFLSRESDSTRDAVHDAIVAELRAQVVQGIQSRRGDLLAAEWIAPVYLDPEEVRIRREGDEVFVEGNVRLRDGARAERVQALHVALGGERVTVFPDESAGDDAAIDGARAVPFSARIPAGAAGDGLRIECEAGARDRYVRSYTFVVPEADAR